MFLLYSLVVLLLALFIVYYIQRLTKKRDMVEGFGEEMTDDVNPQSQTKLGQDVKSPDASSLGIDAAANKATATSGSASASTTSGSASASTSTSTTSGSDKYAYTDPASANKNITAINTDNIAYLKQEMDKLASLRDRVAKVEKDSAENSKAIAALGEQIRQANKKELGGQDVNKDTVPRVSGLQ